MEQTPKGKIVASLRMLWLRSRERAAALKQHDATCQQCGAKRSKAKGKEIKVEIHHKAGVNNWDKIVETIREQLLVSPDKLECLCVDCHKKITNPR